MNLKLFFITISLTCLSNLSAQSLSAKIVDENNNTLVGATVYFNGTTRGVITNFDGIFNIKIPESIAQPVLVITYLGYETKAFPDITKIPDTIQLKSSKQDLEAINVYTSPFSRDDMERAFKRYFLGTGREARKSEILNLDDIVLYYRVDQNVLYGKSSDPIIIKNDYLGYKITFNLLNFEVKYNTKSIDHIDMKQSFYAGYSFFEDINPNKEHSRIKTYLGSKEHFFKSLISGQMGQPDFKVFFDNSYKSADKIFDVTRKSLNVSEIRLSNYVLSFKEGNNPIEVIVKYKRNFTTIKFLESSVLVDNFGNDLSFKTLFLTGEFANYKLAKTLPSNFSLTQMN